MKKLDNLCWWTAGVLVSLASTLWWGLMLTWGDVIWCALIVLVIAWTHRHKRSAMYATLSCILAATSTGALIGHATHQTSPRPVTHTNEETQLCGLVVGGPWMRTDGWTFDLRIKHHQDARVWLSRAQHTQHNHMVPMPGAQLCLWGKWAPPQKRQYPFERNHQRVRQGVGSMGRFRLSDDIQWVGHDTSWWWRLHNTLAQRRLTLEARLLHLLPGERAGFALAMLTGTKHIITPDGRRPFDRTNTSHILAISGLHLGVFAAFVWLVFSWMLSSQPTSVAHLGLRRLNAIPVLVVLCGYVLLVGAPISAQRALGMVAIILLGNVLRLRVNPLRALCLAIHVLMCWSPWIIFTPGFQLSVSATLGILLFIEARAIDPTPSTRIKQWLGVSCSAGLATLPVVLDLSMEWSWLSIPLNLLITPLVSALIFPALLLGALMSWVHLPASQWIMMHALDGLLMFRELAQFCLEEAGPPWRPGLLQTRWCIVAWVMIMIAIRYHQQKLWSISALCVTWLILSTPGWYADATRKPLVIHALPVGQGDATLIRTTRHTILLDSGGSRFGRDPGWYKVMPMLRHEGIQRLDLAILTHPDLDHMDGFFAIVKHATPRHFYYNADSASHPRLQALLDQLKARGVALHPVAQHATNIQGLPLSLWKPQTNTTSGENHKSLVVTAKHGPFTALLTGDLEAHGEAQWHQTNPGTKITVLKLGHHGSKTSTTQPFLDATSPEVSIVSCGQNNRFGHPHHRVVERLRQRQIPLWRTDVHGLISVEVEEDGQWTVRTVSTQ